MKKPLLILFCFLCLLSCKYEHDVYLRSYVSGYYEVSNIYLHKQLDVHIAISTSSGDGINYLYYVRHSSQGEDKKLYDALCVKNNDVSYNRTVTVPDARPTVPHEYLATYFASVDIVSDSGFDDSHPAGSSLADIMTFCSLSPRSYIDSGYKETYAWGSADGDVQEIKRAFYYANLADNNDPRHPIAKSVPELTVKDLYLLGPGEGTKLAFLKFNQSPTLSKTHTFTVTMTADDGRVFSDTIEMTFD